VSIDTLETVLPQHEAGKVRILASSGAARAAISPRIPTFRESGLPLVATGWNAFFAPSSMPAAAVQRYAAAITEAMKDPDTQRKFIAAQMTPVVSTQAQTQAMLKAYREQWAPVVQKSGYQP
jgi:tripartite-type tricarboxylate transporter receptor subunit TctC